MRYLKKSRMNRKVFGVCGGLGEYFAIDPTIIRILFVAASLFYGAPLAIYIILALVMPEVE